MAGEIIKYIVEKDDSSCKEHVVVEWCGQGRIRARVFQKSRCLPEELQERFYECFEDKINLCEEVVGPDMSTPLAENGMCSFKDTDVDVVVSWGKRRNELLIARYNSISLDSPRKPEYEPTSMRFSHFCGKSSSAIRETDSAT